MLTRYDPNRAPDPERWLRTDEGQRIDIVGRYHKRAGIRLPSPRIHAAIHVMVENQVAMGDETPVAATLQRLMGEGVDRHEALHAIGSVLAVHLNEILKNSDDAPEDTNAVYYAKLKELTIERWRAEFG